jgi:RimJ/RimL family protein N-acetyltransferase
VNDFFCMLLTIISGEHTISPCQKDCCMTEFPVNPTLPDDVLQKRQIIPVKPAPVTLTGQQVRLQPLDITRDVPLLFARSNGEPATLGTKSIPSYDADTLVWRYMGGGPFATADALAAWLQGQLNASDGSPLAVFDIATDSPIGVANFMTNSPAHLSIELGNIWYSPLVQGTSANTEATYLMLKHAFELGYRRVIWKCDALNARSRKAALRLGFQFEGIHESHFIIKNRNRDTAWFRMLDKEWNTVQKQFMQYLYGTAE